MYGMTHRGMRQMVIDAKGEAEWEALERSIGIGPAEQISLNVYDDALTIRILSATADCMGYTVPECLEAFGRYWIHFAERGSYGSIMDFTGNNLETFISNLDRMHQAVVLAMPEARVPSFNLVESGSGTLRVQYRSERDGLEHMVIGLLKGLLDRFGLAGEVQQVESTSNAVEFLITHEQG